MRPVLGSGLVLFGFALVVATAIRAMADMLQADRFNPWSVVLTTGCVLMSIGFGLARNR